MRSQQSLDCYMRYYFNALIVCIPKTLENDLNRVFNVTQMLKTQIVKLNNKKKTVTYLQTESTNEYFFHKLKYQKKITRRRKFIHKRDV